MTTTDDPAAGLGIPCMRLGTLLPGMSLMLTLLTSAATQAQFTFTSANGELTIVRYTGESGTATIPSTVDGLPVTRIGSAAFLESQNLTNVVIPDSVTAIGGWAFSRCSRLTSVTVPNSVTAINEGTFYWCNSLASVTLPKSVTSIGHFAFDGCLNLTNVTLGNSITNIGYQSFANTHLAAVTIPTSVISIDDRAFTACRSLTSLTIPDGVISIGKEAFHNCGGLTEVSIGSHVTSIGDSAFDGCWKLARLTIGRNVATIGNLAFAYNQLTNLMIPDSVVTVGDYAFRRCDRMVSVMIGKNVVSLGNGVFAESSNLRRVYFQGDAPHLSDGAFGQIPAATIYYSPGTTGWTPWFGERPTVLWNPRILTGDTSIGIRVGRFGFGIVGAAGVPVVIEACTDLSNPNWIPLSALILNSEGTAQFNDLSPADSPTRSYRFRPE